MPPRLHCPLPLHSGTQLELPAAAVRHAQVLRLQPGDALVLFDGGPGGVVDDCAAGPATGAPATGLQGGECDAVVERMGRQSVLVRVGAHRNVEREPARAVHLAVGMPANERMDWLVEKASELGAASIQPLLCERSVLRLTGERADRRRAHWQQIAVAACEQSGRNRVPPVHPPLTLPAWLAGLPGDHAGPGAVARWLLCLAVDAQPVATAGQGSGPSCVLSGPEGGLSPTEEAAARAAGFRNLSLGPRVLRAETAPLAALAAITLAA